MRLSANFILGGLSGALLLVTFVGVPAALAQPLPQYSPAYVRSALYPCENPEEYGRRSDGQCVRWSDMDDRNMRLASTGQDRLVTVVEPPPGKKPKPGAGRMNLRMAFAKGSAALSEQVKVDAQQVAEALKAPGMAGRVVRLSGHTDVSGGDRINRPLSLARARAVRDYLVELGVPAGSIEVAGMASDQLLPKISKTSEKQRRVEATVGY